MSFLRKGGGSVEVVQHLFFELQSLESGHSLLVPVQFIHILQELVLRFRQLLDLRFKDTFEAPKMINFFCFLYIRINGNIPEIN